MLRVKRGGSVPHRGRVYKEGEELPEDELRPKQKAELLRKGGYAEVVDVAEAAPTLPPGVADLSPGKKPTELAKQIKGTPEPAAATATPTWNLDPAQLEGKSLDELNVMISERDPKIPELNDRDEAVAWLTQDFEG